MLPACSMHKSQMHQGRFSGRGSKGFWYDVMAWAGGFKHDMAPQGLPRQAHASATFNRNIAEAEDSATLSNLVHKLAH